MFYKLVSISLLFSSTAAAPEYFWTTILQIITKFPKHLSYVLENIVVNQIFIIF